jgi:Rieske Fe-S protein
LGLFSYLGIRNLSYLSRPAPKKVFISKPELEKIKTLYLGEDFILVKREGGVLSFSRRCPHLGCKLNFDPETELILCPCHQSKFNLQGKYLSGPAKRDLKKFKSTLKEEGLEIELT